MKQTTIIILVLLLSIANLNAATGYKQLISKHSVQLSDVLDDTMVPEIPDEPFTFTLYTSQCDEIMHQALFDVYSPKKSILYFLIQKPPQAI